MEELRDDERQVCEVWTRVMGYHRPVSEFNLGKQAEFKERRFFRETKLNDHTHVYTGHRCHIGLHV